jgi:dihydroorotate dehydrogenase
MAFTAKWTGKYGEVEIADIAITAGSAEAQSDTISVNIDATNMSKGEALQLLSKISDAIHAAKWPPA